MPNAGWMRDNIIASLPYRDGHREVIDLTTEEAWWTAKLAGLEPARRAVGSELVRVETLGTGREEPEAILRDGWQEPPPRHPTRAQDSLPIVGQRVIEKAEAGGFNRDFRAIAEPYDDHDDYYVAALPTQHWYEMRLGMPPRRRSEFRLGDLWVE